MSSESELLRIVNDQGLDVDHRAFAALLLLDLRSQYEKQVLEKIAGKLGTLVGLFVLVLLLQACSAAALLL
jgi:hypothetical protein